MKKKTFKDIALGEKKIDEIDPHFFINHTLPHVAALVGAGVPLLGGLKKKPSIKIKKRK